MYSVRLNRDSPRNPSGTEATLMPGTSRLLRLLVWPSSVLVRVAATCVTHCQRPRTRVIDGVIEFSLRVEAAETLDTCSRPRSEKLLAAPDRRWGCRSAHRTLLRDLRTP